MVRVGGSGKDGLHWTTVRPWQRPSGGAGAPSCLVVECRPPLGTRRPDVTEDLRLAKWNAAAVERIGEGTEGKVPTAVETSEIWSGPVTHSRLYYSRPGGLADATRACGRVDTALRPPNIDRKVRAEGREYRLAQTKAGPYGPQRSAPSPIALRSAQQTDSETATRPFLHTRTPVPAGPAPEQGYSASTKARQPWWRRAWVRSRSSASGGRSRQARSSSSRSSGRWPPT